jgi:hypothetical protein
MPTPTMLTPTMRSRPHGLTPPPFRESRSTYLPSSAAAPGTCAFHPGVSFPAEGATNSQSQVTVPVITSSKVNSWNQSTPKFSRAGTRGGVRLGRNR